MTYLTCKEYDEEFNRAKKEAGVPEEMNWNDDEIIESLYIKIASLMSDSGLLFPLKYDPRANGDKWDWEPKWQQIVRKELDKRIEKMLLR